MARVGQGVLWAAIVVCVAAVVAFVLAVLRRDTVWARRGRAAILAFFALTTVASGLLVWALLTDQFGLLYVAQQSSRDMPWAYKIAAWWSGQEGSLLFWLWLLSMYTAVVARHRHTMANPLWPGALAILSAINLFFVVLVSFAAPPFVELNPAPADGRGMNPLLQSFWMVSHPVALYLGFIGFSVPFAFAMSALWVRQPGDTWILLTKRWSLAGWLFLSLGMLLGARWAYEELGWGGYWGWDPVENASLVPWLTATAYIHSVIITERRGMLKRWTAVLVLLTFFLTIFGTFMTRSGILVSVHAFVESEIGTYFILFMGLVLAGGFYLISSRRDMLRDERHIESYASKEFSFLLNNLLFLGLAFAVFWGTVFPLLSRLFGTEVTVGAPFFTRITGPMFLAIVLLMGIGPVLSWRRANWNDARFNILVSAATGLAIAALVAAAGFREVGVVFSVAGCVFVTTTILLEIVKGVWARLRFTDDPPLLVLPRLFNRNPRRYGGYIVHFGVVLIVLGIAVHQHYFVETLPRGLTVGETVVVGPYTVTFEGLEEEARGNVPVVFANLLVRYDGQALGYLRPAKVFHPGFAEMQGPETEVAIHSTWWGDLYAILGNWDEYGSTVGFQFFWNPMVGWIWTGGLIMVFGTVFSLWPRRQRITVAVRRALEALQELEYDFAMQKVGRREYEELKAELLAAAGRIVSDEEIIRSALERELDEELRRAGEPGRFGPAGAR